MERTVLRRASAGTTPMRFGPTELAGAVADVGVLVPLAVTLIVGNGLSATAVLLPAGLLYVVAASVYRLPIPVQPLKAFAAIAIARGLGADVVAAASLAFGAIFVALGRTGLLDRVARVFPRVLIRGVQLTVGLLFMKVSWQLVTDPPGGFARHALDAPLAIALAVVIAIALGTLRRWPVSLALVVVGAVVAGLLTRSEIAFGPSGLSWPSLHGEAFWIGLTVLVVPQLPLTFANSCLATADVAQRYFGAAATSVTPGRLATTLGVANLVAGTIGGMPCCHGAGGVTAHHRFGARTGGAPLAMGLLLLLLALGLGASLVTVLAAFPLPILAALLVVSGLLHITLLNDLEGADQWAVAVGVGLLGFITNLSVAIVCGLIVEVPLRRALSRGAKPRASPN